jgi:hypothetical protein
MNWTEGRIGMVFLGLLATLAGFLIAFLSLGLASSAGARLTIVLVGIAVSLIGMFGILNRAYLRKAIWRK